MSLIYLFYPFFLCFFFYKSKIDLETRLRPKRKQKTDKQNRLRKHICVEKGGGHWKQICISVAFERGKVLIRCSSDIRMKITKKIDIVINFFLT